MDIRILIVSAVFPPEPIVSAQISENIAVELVRNHNVTVLCPPPTKPFGYQFNNKKSVTKYKVEQMSSFTCPAYNLFGRFRENYSFGKQCYVYIKKNWSNIDVIYANTGPLFAQFLAVRIANKYKIPIIIHIQDIYPESLSNKIPGIGKWVNIVLRPLDKYVLKNSTSIIAISEKMKCYLGKTRKIELSKINVVHNWQDESAFIQYRQTVTADNLLKSPFIFMYLGNIGPVAGVELLIDAFVKANFQDVKLVIAGSGSMKEKLQSKCKSLGNEKIEFWIVPDGKVPEVQSQANVLLLPVKRGASFSSLPSKLPAYMFSAKPIIACVDEQSDIAGFIMQTNCGWIVEPENVDVLTKKMKEVVTLDELHLTKMGKQGCEYALEHFSREKNVSKVVQIILDTKNNEK